VTVPPVAAVATGSTPMTSTADAPTGGDGAGPHDPGRWAHIRRFVVSVPSRALRRYPGTTFVVLVPILVGLVSGSAWRSVERTSWFTDIAYGPPAAVDGHWWGFVSGMFFVQGLLWVYLPILVLLAVFGGVYERRAGTLQLLVVVIGGQALAALVTAVFFVAVDDRGWVWADQLATVNDVGISAGLFVLFGAFSATMQDVWRRRARAALTAFLLAMLLSSGHLWDVEHLVGWTIGLAVGPLLVGRRPLPLRLDLGARTQRSLVALIVLALALSVVIEAVYPGFGGPFTSTVETDDQAGVSAIATVLAALLLFAVADGLRRGHRVAWITALVINVLTLVSVAIDEDSAQRVADLVIFGAQLVILVLTVGAFRVRSQRRSGRRVGRRLLKVVIGLFVYTALGFAVLQDDFEPQATVTDMVGEFATRLVFSTTHSIEPTTTAARVFVGSIGAIWLLTLLVTLIGLLYSARRVPPEPDQDERLRELLETYESSTIGYMLTWRGNTIWFSADGRTAIGYRVVGSVALALGDPVGPHDARGDALAEFDRFCFDHGWSPCFFAAGELTRDLAPAVGWKAVQVAEDDVVPLPDLEFKGKAWQDVRTALNKAGKQNITLQVTTWADCRPVVTDQLHAISEGWVSDKSLPEMGFTLGTLREADDPRVRLHLAVDDDGTLEGFTSWMPVYRDGQVVGWCLDLMRRRDEGFRPVMEFLIGASAMQFKDEGFELMSLSAAPLARAPQTDAIDTGPSGSDQVVLQRLLDFLGDTLEPYYGFRSLLAFKSKFQPRHAPMYLVFPDESALAEIGIGVARAYMPTASAWDWLTMSVDMFLPSRSSSST
jgi:phosphatidylglycerol lysyltransferase